MSNARDGLEVYKDLRRRLIRRESPRNVYLAMLESVLGRSTDGAVVSTAEHVGFFNRRGHITFALPQLCLSAASREPVDLMFLTTAAIPLSNRAYPKGILLPSSDGVDRVNLFTNNDKSKSPLFLDTIQRFDTDALRRMTPAGHWLQTSLLRNAEKSSYAEQLAACMEDMLRKWIPSDLVGEVEVHVSERIEVALLAALMRQGDSLLETLLFSRELRCDLGCLLNNLAGENNNSFLGVMLRYNRNGTLEPLVERIPGIWEGKDYVCEANLQCVLHELEAGNLWPSPVLSMLLLSYLPNLPINGGPNQSRYYARTLSSMNSLFGLNRSAELNVHGYYREEFDYDAYPLWSDGALLPAYGTGVALCCHPVSPEWALHQYQEHARFTLAETINQGDEH